VTSCIILIYLKFYLIRTGGFPDVWICVTSFPPIWSVLILLASTISKVGFSFNHVRKLDLRGASAPKISHVSHVCCARARARACVCVNIWNLSILKKHPFLHFFEFLLLSNDKCAKWKYIYNQFREAKQAKNKKYVCYDFTWLYNK